MILNISKGSNEREQVVFPRSAEGDLWVTRGKQNESTAARPWNVPIAWRPSSPQVWTHAYKILEFASTVFPRRRSNLGREEEDRGKKGGADKPFGWIEKNVYIHT